MAQALAAAFLAGEWTVAGMRLRGRAALAATPSWLAPLVRSVVAKFHDAPLDRHDELSAFIARQRAFRTGCGGRCRRVPPWPPSPATSG
jgi:hypothetical protein